MSVGLALAVPGSAPAATAGAAGLGDRLFPGAGNGGYDAKHYDLTIDARDRGRIEGDALLRAAATQDLTRFNLDLRDQMTVSGVAVNGAEASFHHRGEELIVSPAAPIRADSEFQVRIDYRGKPRPDIRGLGYPTGWIATSDGAWVANEPIGAATWFPSNNHPSDKASFTFRVTVRSGRQVVANGELMSRERSGGRTTFTWEQVEPMATYLATTTVGRFRIIRDQVAGVPEYSAYDPAFRGELDGITRMRRTTASAMKLFAETFGPYPFSTTGLIIDDPEWDRIPYQLETQTRALYRGVVGSEVVAHEVAHQWFGNSVTPAAWEDVWLNEAIAQWSTWLWRSERPKRKRQSLRSSFRREYRHFGPQSPLWSYVLARPSQEPGQLFNLAIYQRGAMTIEALRQEIGNADFFRILREWNSRFRYGNASAIDFTALCEEVSGEDLDKFFRIWIYKAGKPKRW